MRHWLLGGHTGCAFAKSLAADKSDGSARITFVAQPQLDVTRLNRLLDECSRQQTPAVVIFPNVRSVGAVADLVHQLASDQRWTCSRPRIAGFQRNDDLVRILWRSPFEGWASEVMGLAPLLTMPVTRRAPFVGLALWPGGPSEHRLYPRDEGKADVLDLLDTSHPFDDKAVASMKDRSILATKTMMSSPNDSVRNYRIVAFALPAGSLTVGVP